MLHIIKSKGMCFQFWSKQLDTNANIVYIRPLGQPDLLDEVGIATLH